jgi:orotate phosphoribosyltransferase
VELLRAAGAEPVAALIALDRQEKGVDGLSAVQAIERDCGLRVIPLVTLRDVLAYLGAGNGDAQTVAAIRAYQAQYCI